MPVSKQHFRLFIASPSDVQAERDAVEEVIKKVNLQNDEGIHLDVIRWEDFATPNWGHPQDVIFENTQFEKTDIFVAIFWSRMGTPSGRKNPTTGNEYLSGTMEELQAAHELYANSRLARLMLYFCTRAVKLESSAAAEQHKKVLEFKEFLDSGHQALYQTFGATEEFKFKFQNDLLVAVKSLPRTQPAKLGTHHSQEPNLGEFVNKMADRFEQVNQFNDFFLSSIRKYPGRPQIYLVHGEEDECHSSLIERLIHTRIKQFAEKMWGEQNGIVTIKKIPSWPYDGEPAVRQRHLTMSLFMEFDPAYMGDVFSATALSSLSSLSLKPLIIVQHEIRATRWDRPTKELIKWYLNSFWAGLEITNSGPQFLVFLNVIYPSKTMSGQWHAWLKLKRFDKTHIERESREIFLAKQSGCPRLMFKELMPIRLDEVKEWFNLHNIYDSEKKRLECAEKIFKTPDGRVVPYKSMMEIEHELKIIHQEYLQKKGFSFV